MENKNQESDSFIEIPEVSLPSGGGAIKGIDEQFKVNTANGTASFSIPLPISPGRNGYTPSLGLSYNSGAGNSPFGLGWQVEVPSISIKTDKALPKYNGEDTYQFTGSEELVPYLKENTSNNWEAVQDPLDDYNIKRYRPRTEDAYSKIEKITHSNHGTYWKVTGRDNSVIIFGRSPSARIADPEDGTKIFKWLAELSYDDKGNWIKYRYKTENLGNTPNELHEKQRLNEASKITNQYIKRIQYGNKKAYYPDKNTPYNPIDPTTIKDSEEAKHFFELVFDYGEHHEETPLVTEETDLLWSHREDAFSSFRPGFEIRIGRLCKRILMFHKFEELGETPCLTKSLEFNYTPSNINNSGQSETTYLTSAIQSGYIKKDNGSYAKKSLPAMRFDYQTLEWNHTIQKVEEENIANMPVGLSNNYQWTDLYGEGISGILTEQSGGWYYKQNLGDLDNSAGVQFTTARQVAVKPSISGLSSGVLTLQDLEANGKKQVVVNSQEMKGFYTLNTEEQDGLNLDSFVPFKNIPNVNRKDPNTRFIDLNGDGKPELVVSEENAFMWYENKGKEGYEEGVKSFKPPDEDQGPAIVFSDADQSIFLADLNGDGLTDIVRIRNGEICYWPNKGYGNFGVKITMSNAPLFDYPDQYNPNYLHLADVSGTGATDIIYLGKNKFKAYINHSGNSWSDAHEINPFVQVDNSGKLSVVDLLGTGTGCIVWSTDLPDQAPMRYIDLMSSKKPHVMTGYNNNMGKEVTFSYKSSIFFYLKDKREKIPWITKLPFPVQVVATTTSIDHISSSQLSTSYQYHHGYYDHGEREFRGFGMVEQTDRESFETYEETNELDMPPVLTKTWIHTGSYQQQGKFSKQYQQEYYQDDAIDYPFPDSVIADIEGMSDQETREATRALRGKILRQERYTLDGTETIPYTITETNFTVKQIQPQAENNYGVYQSLARETLSYSCERNTADPRVAHQMVLASDEYGHPTKTAQISYPRKSTVSGAYEEQQQLTVLLQMADYENEVDDYYRLGLPTGQKQYEIQRLVVATGRFFTVEDLNTQLSNANTLEEVNILLHHEDFSTGVQARLIGWSNTYYKEGALKALALPNYKESIIMSTARATAAYDGKVDADKMEAAGYHKKDDHWWMVSEKPSYQDADGFYLPYQTKDVFGNVSSVGYDTYQLAAVEATDALKNIVIAVLDYRTLSVQKITDINNTISEAITDELGMVIATTIYGTEEGLTKGDSPIDHYVRVESPTLNDVVAHPLHYVQEATGFFYYHLEPWEAGNLPPHFVQVQRETHVSELEPGEDTKVQISLGYSDGFGRELQSKVKMDEDQWLVSGRTVYNNKEKPVKQYEPFIADTYVFQTEEEVAPVGVTPVLYYDALGRLIKTETPDGFFSKVIFDSWQLSSYDPNDTVKDSDNYTENIGLTGSNDPKGIALEKAETHYNTPTTVVLDSLGREFMTMQLKEETGEPLITLTEFDILGNPLTQTDPGQYVANQTRGEDDQVNNFMYTYDLAGNVLKTVSRDAGTSYSLINAMGNPLYAWNARDYQTKVSYDALHRPTLTEVSGNGLDIVAQKMEYGTDTSKNQNGQLITSYDQAGKKENTSFTFKGEPIETTQQLCSDYKSEPDWEDITNVAMEAEIYNSAMVYDALGRVIKSTQPDGSIHTPEYHPIGWLKSVQVQLREVAFGSASTAPATTFVENIDYDAKGQRTQITYGNGVSTTYTYDEQTFRLTHLMTKREETTGTPTTLQDISYVYDPVGNIVKITDNSHNKVFTAGQAVAADMEYVYDALYQLKEATGREHLALSETDYQSDNNTFKSTHFANINDANQLRSYTRKYTYDDSGNLTQLKHIGENSFTRDMTVANDSNRTITDEMDTTVDVDNYFDVAGNMLNLEHLTGISWNYRNNIASATIIERDSENDAEYYVYDGSGQRSRKVKETYDSQGNLLWTEEKIYLGGVEIKRKYQGNSKTLKEDRSTAHIMDDTRRIALVHYWDQSNDSSVTTVTNKIHYQLGNHLGSASMELDEIGQLISYEEYFPFGGTAFTAGSSETEVKLKEYRYTGKERDDTTGLYYYGARYYAPWMGRWLNPDPAGTVDGLNLYRYVRNNPIILIDPNGGAALPSELFDEKGKWTAATPGQIRDRLLGAGWESAGSPVDVSSGKVNPKKGWVLKAPDGSSYVRVMNKGGVSAGSQAPRVVMTSNDPTSGKVIDGKFKFDKPEYVDKLGRPAASIADAHIDITKDTINSKVLHEHQQAARSAKKAKLEARKGRGRRGVASVGGIVFTAIVLADGAVAIHSADTWEKRFQVASGLAFSEAAGYGMVKRYGVGSGFGIGVIFGIIGAAGVYKQKEMAVSEFLNSEEFDHIDWASLSRSERHQIRSEAETLLFKTPPMTMDEFNDLNNDNWGGPEQIKRLEEKMKKKRCYGYPSKGSMAPVQIPCN